MSEKTHLGSRLKYLRKNKGWSLDEMARRSGSAKSYIWELENKPDLKPSFQKVCDLADALSISINTLRGIDDPFNEGYIMGQQDAIRAIKEL